MDHYIDLTLIANPEIAQPHLMGALINKLHLALAAQRSEQIGVSFPAVQSSPVWLGNCLRIHGNQTNLAGLMNLNWLASMRDHVHSKSVLAVPPNASFRVVSRVQAKSNPERLRRRQIRRHGLSADEVLNQVPDTATERLNLPYVQLRSKSTAQPFRLFIRHGKLLETATVGTFGAYGLSATATIPWF